MHRIFLVEGLATIAFSILVFIFTPHFPAQNRCLSVDDQAHLLARLQLDKGEEASRMVDASWWKIVLDYKIWLLYVSLRSLLEFRRRTHALTLSPLPKGHCSSSAPTCLPDR